ncbi:sensor histidine kinase, partial [Acinetobacter baumannii]
SKSISIPIMKVSRMAKLIETGQYKKEVETRSDIKEIDELIASINNLSLALDEQEMLRKQLTTDIAHELRTPLTTIKGHLDVMIAGIWEPTPERLVSINEEVVRISRMVDELRHLSKYDSE